MWNFTSNASTDEAVVLATDLHTAAGANVAVSSTTLNGAPQLLAGRSLKGSLCRWSEEGERTEFTSTGPLNTFKLVLNGQDRFKEQSGKYFNQVQPMHHHSGTPYPGIYSYSFALKPEEHQPSGTCNFSRIDNAQVAVTLKGETAQSTTLNMFATNYNVLRIQSGMGGLAFSN